MVRARTRSARAPLPLAQWCCSTAGVWSAPRLQVLREWLQLRAWADVAACACGCTRALLLWSEPVPAVGLLQVAGGSCRGCMCSHRVRHHWLATSGLGRVMRGAMAPSAASRPPSPRSRPPLCLVHLATHSAWPAAALTHSSSTDAHVHVPLCTVHTMPTAASSTQQLRRQAGGRSTIAHIRVSAPCSKHS